MHIKNTSEWREDISKMKEAEITPIQAAAELEVLLDRYEWFYSYEVDTSNRIVVYVNYMDSSVLRIVPEILYGHKVIIAFAQYLTCGETYSTGGSGNSVLKHYNSNTEE